MSNSIKTAVYDLTWYAQGDWKEGWQAIPNGSIDKDEFINLYSANPERWQKAFQFLAGTDLKNLTVGRYELEGADLYVNISEYDTKNEADAKCEAHLKYVDIQYLISGEEKMGVTPLSDTKEATPYNEEKDIYFMKPNSEKYYLANSGNFFIFFPSDAHRPSVKVKENAPVKKAVVKLRIA